jgi:lactoylglutathione lyase
MASDTKRPRPVGINHVALEVDDIERALAFYGRLLEIRRVERAHGGAFVDLGDQFIAMFEPGAHEDRHFGLVVDDKEAARRALQEAGVDVQPRGSVDFRDPWGNHVQLVEYGAIQFTKADHVLRGMGLEDLVKSEQALDELRAKGLSPD